MRRLFRNLMAISAALLCSGISEISGKLTDSIINENIGDVNFDKIIDARDATLILGEYSTVSIGNELNFTIEQFESADVNSDGKADSIDASYILSYYSFISTGGNKTFKEFILNENYDL